jgi:hypothetical protein
MKSQTLLTTLLLMANGAWAADRQVAVRFQTMVGSERFACGSATAGRHFKCFRKLPRVAVRWLKTTWH